MNSLHDISKSVSVIVNTYNRCKNLETLLVSLKYLRYKNFEVIIVNGPSTDGTAQVIEKFKSSIRVASCPVRNLAVSRNIGLSLAQGDIVCFIDDDAIPEPDWLDEIVRAHDSPKVGAVGGFLRDNSGFGFQTKVIVCDEFGDAEFYATEAEARKVMSRDNVLRYFAPIGANSSFSRQALQDIRGFDEQYSYYLDETDVLIRIHERGYDIKFNPNAEVHHKFAASDLRNANRMPTSYYQISKSKAYFCVRHAQARHSLKVIFGALADWILKTRNAFTGLLDNKQITKHQHETLTKEVDAGVQDGIREALVSDSPKFLESALGAIGSMQVFPTLLPADERLAICLLTQNYPPAVSGGIAVWFYGLAKALASLGHEVSVVTKGRDSITVDFEDGVWVHRVPITSHAGRAQPALLPLPDSIRDLTYSFYDEVERVSQRRGLDVVMAPIWDVEGLACLASNNFRVILALQSSYNLVLPSKPEWSRNEFFMKEHFEKVVAAETFMLEQVSVMIGISTANFNDIVTANRVNKLPLLTKIIPIGISDNAENNEPVYISKGSAVNILFVGRFEKRKGIDVLLEAIPRLLHTYPGLTITLVGDNSLPIDPNDSETYWQSFVKKHKEVALNPRLKVCGVVSDAELDEHYKKCDIFIAPSRYESFGIIYLEAMSRGKPCIGCNVGGIPEIIDDGETGILAEPGDLQSLLQATDALVRNPAFRKDMGRKGRERFKKHFSDKMMAQSTAEFFREIMKQGVFMVPRPEACRLIKTIVQSELDRHIGNLRAAPEARASVLPQARRILIDVTHTSILDYKTGIQRVVRNIAAASATNESGKPEIVPVRLKNGEMQRVEGFLSGSDKLVPSEFITPFPGDVFVALDNSWTIRHEHELFFPLFKSRGGRIIGIIYDITPLTNPEYVGCIDRGFASWFSLLLSYSDALFCISKAVVDDVAGYVREHLVLKRRLPAGYFHLGADTRELLATQGVRLPDRALRFKKNIFLMVGSIDIRKGYMCALKAFTKAWLEGVDVTLCIAGKVGNTGSDIDRMIMRHPELGKRLFVFNNIQDDELANLYKIADFVLAASLAEGFGLPLLEAAMYNKPVLASDIAVFREVAGESATYFKTGDADALLAGILDMIQKKDSNSLGGTKRISFMNWTESAWTLVRRITQNEYVTTIGTDEGK